MADDSDWLNNYWSQINYEPSLQNSLFRDTPNQMQQDDAGQDPSMGLTSWLLAQQPPGPTRSDFSQQYAYPYIPPYAANGALSPGFMQPQPPQPTPATSFQSRYPTPLTTPSMHPAPVQTAASALSLAQNQMDPGPPAQAPAPAPAHKSKPKPKPPRDLSGYSFTPRDPSSKALRDRGDLVQPLNEADAADKVVYDSNTIARDILIAAGRHPTEPALNHHLFRLRYILTQVDNTSDLSTFRWDIVDSPAMQVPPTKVPPTMAPSANKPSKPVANGHHQHTPQYHQQQPPLQHQPLPLSAGPPPRDQHQPITTPQPTPPSRPPPQQQQQQQQQQQKQPLPQKQPAPLQHMVRVEPPSPSLHPLQQQKTSPPRRESLLTQPQRQKKTPSKPKQQTGKMVGKKSTSGPKIEVAIPLSTSVSYPVYSCEWQGCQSELHSLALLKQHLLKSHIPYTLNCGWAGCTCTEKMPASDLSNHVKTEHLEPIAWKLGDGPSVPGTGETS